MITTISKISFAGQAVPQIIQAVQGDTGRAIQFALSDFVIPEGAEATYYIEKPSGEAVYNTATIDGNNVIVELTAQSIAEAGENYGQVRIMLNDEIVTSFDFILIVRPFRGIGAIESTTEMNVFDEAVEEAKEEIETSASEAISQMQTDAEEVAQEVIASIPADYTALSGDVADLKEEIDAALSGSQTYCDTIPEGADLDAYTTPGNYKVISSTIAGSLHNSPATVAFRLFVMVTSVNDRVMQMAFINSAGQNSKLAMRFYNGSTWSDWSHLISYEVVSDMLPNSFLLTATDATAIASGTDLDALTTPGNFKCTSASIAGSLVNCPVSVAFALKVVALSQSARLMQVLYVQSVTMSVYRRFYNGSTWNAWFRDAKQEEIINLSNTILTESNYLTYFPNGLFSDAQPNTIWGINDSSLFGDAPIGDEWVGTSDRTGGSIRGTLFTFSQVNRHDNVQTGLSQLFVGYRNTSYKPTFSYRIAIVTNGAYVWSDWSKFEENGYLHASNMIIYGGNMAATFSDMNDMPPNAICQLDLNLDGSDAEHTLAHHPAPGVSCVAMCYAFSYTTDHGRVQTVYTIDGRLYWRYGYQQASNDYRWTAWRKVAIDDGSFMQNKGRLANGTDLNTIANNSIHLLGGQTGAQYIHNPLADGAGYLTTKMENGIVLQICEALSGARYSRYSTDSGSTWSNWV